MARITTYDNDTTLSDRDKLIGTDAADGSTKNFTLDELRDYMLNGGRFNGIIPQDRYVIVDEDGNPTQGLVYETTTAMTDVAIPSNFTWFLGRDADGFIIELRRFGQTTVLFPFDIESFIGKTWVSSDYLASDGVTGGVQTITAFLDPPFTPTSTANNQTWRFRTTLSNPLPADAEPTFAGRVLNTVVVSSLDRRTVVIAGDVDIRGTGGGGSGGSQFADQVALQNFITDDPAFRTAIGAGTSSLILGTTTGTALAGDTQLPAIPGNLPSGRITGLNLNTASPVIFTASAAATTEAAALTEFYAVATNSYSTGQLAYVFFDASVQSGILVDTLLFISPNQTAAGATAATDWRIVSTALDANVVLHDATGVQNRIAIFGENGNIIGDSGIIVDPATDTVTATTFAGAATTVDNANGTALPNVAMWFGTQAEFDALTEVTDGSVAYFIRPNP